MSPNTVATLSRRFLLSLLALAFFQLPAAANEEAKTLKVGDTMKGFTLEDQFENSQSVDGSTAVILFSRDMDGGDLLRSALEGKPPEYLPERHAVYVADIHRMPGLIARMFAVPKMRKRPYPMLLDRDGEATKALPDQEKHGTLIELDNLRVVKIEYLSDPEEIKKRLEHREKVPRSGTESE